MSVEAFTVIAFVIAYVFYLLGYHDCRENIIKIIEEHDEEDAKQSRG